MRSGNPPPYSVGHECSGILQTRFEVLNQGEKARLGPSILILHPPSKSTLAPHEETGDGEQTGR
jgi:hypothetical protein